MTTRIEYINGFIQQDIKEYIVEPFTKIEDNRGYIYLVQDSVFPEHIKIGRTINMEKRLAAYNSDKPYNTTTLLIISKMFRDAKKIEKQILENIYKSIPPMPMKYEWFASTDIEVILKVIKDAEEMYE